jgi:tripartite-type tricarboxylate transporter receptor subunit TctC
LQSQGLNAAGGSPEDFARFIKSETERWARVIKSMDAAKKAVGTANP